MQVDLVLGNMSQSTAAASRAQSEAGNLKTQLQACRRCNEKKTRCDKKWPVCSLCAKRNLECVYTGAPRRRGPGKSKQHVQQLEERLRRMEALIQQQPVTSQPVIGKAVETSMAPASQDGPALQTSFENGCPVKDSQKLINSQHSVPMIDPSLDSTRSEKSQDQRPPLERLRERVKNSMQMPGFLANAFARIYSNNEISWFVAPLLDEINTQFPMFDVDTLVRRIESTVPGERHSPAWTTIIESIMARVVLVRAASDGVERCYEMAWDQMSSGLKRLPVLLTLVAGTDSTDVLDALLSMAMFMRGTADQRTTAMLVNSAIRTHWTTTTIPPQIASKEEASTTRKLWIMYILDQELSLCHGIPPSIRQGDISPHGSLLHNQNLASYSRPKALFYARARLAVVQEAIFARLYSPTALASLVTCADTISAAIDLRDLLEAAQREIAPFVASLGSHNHLNLHYGANDHGFSFSGLQAPLPIHDTNLVYLYFSFYHCISMIYTAVLRACYPCEMAASSNQAVAGANGVGYLTDAAIIAQAKMYLMTAARSTLLALRSLPLSTLPEFWHLIPYPIAAALTLLQPLLDRSHPQGTEEAISDTSLISQLTSYLREAAADKGFPLHRLIAGFAEVERLAQIAAHGSDAGCNDIAHYEAIRNTLTRATTAMYLAQGLVNNLPTKDQQLSRQLANLLSEREFMVPLPEGQPPFAPDVLCLNAMVKSL